MRNLIARLFLLLTVLVIAVPLFAQNVASITGVVTDESGAVVPGVSVVLVNTATNATYKAETNEVGSYVIARVDPGPGYRITFTREGFKPSVANDLYLNVGSIRTQNARLSVGAASQTVEVSASASAVTLDTTSATVGNNYEVQMVNSLPIQLRDSPAALFSLQPGVTSDGATTGARQDQNNVTLDGLDVNDMATGNFGSVIANAPVDSVQEMRAVTAGAGSDQGQGGGGQFQLVTKSGTNTFHGSLFEYNRITAFEANNWFSNNAGVPRAALIRNQFGGNVGGPIRKDKAFFFFEYNGRRDNQGTQVTNIVPLDSFRNGTLSYINNKTNPATGAACGGYSRVDTTPTCISTLSSADVANLDPLKIGFSAPLLSFINARYPHVNDFTKGDGINTGGYRFNAPVHLVENDYVTKLDYTLNDTMKLWARASVQSQRQGDDINYDAPIQFPGDPLTHLITNASYAYVVGHTWTISSTKTNAFTYGETRARLGFPVAYNPTGTTQYSNFGGDGSGSAILTSPYGSAVNAQDRVTPIPVVKDDFNWQKGQHNFQFGGQFKFIKTSGKTYLNYNEPSLGLGGNMNTLIASLRPDDIRSAGTLASIDYDSAFALALGRFATVSSTYNYDSKGTPLNQGSGMSRKYRYYEFEGYFGDTWRFRPSLTFTLGVRYQWYSVPYEVNGQESIQNFTFDKYFADRLAQSAAGLSGADSVPFIQYDLGGKANHAAGYYKGSPLNFAPRVSFSYNPSFDRKSVFSGGAGIIFDHTVVNAVQYFQDHSSFFFQGTNQKTFGVSGDPVTSLKNDPRFASIDAIPVTPAAPVITRPLTPYVEGGNPIGLANGGYYNTIIDPELKNPYSIAYNLGFQHEFPQGFILKTNYVGRLGRRLLAQADAGQLLEFPDTISGQNMSTAFAHVTQELRAGADPTNLPSEGWFENVVIPGIGQMYTPCGDDTCDPYPNNTSFLADNFATLLKKGDFADAVQALSANGLIDYNVGMASQFSENTFYTNKGSSAYHGLLVNVHKNLTSGLQFDFNYTWSHSIDNVSLIANSSASGGYGFICDVVRPRECRGNSDFDVRHIITGNALYNLPFGRGKAYAANSPIWLDEMIGGWEISGLPSWHSGEAFSTVTSAFVAGYANNAPAIFNGDHAAVRPNAHRDSSGTVYLFTDPSKAFDSFTGPVGFQIGSRNNLRGPNYVNFNLGLGKDFPLGIEQLKLKFRADAFNALNHASFAAPVTGKSSTDITSGNFGKITSTANSARVLQLALRLEF